MYTDNLCPNNALCVHRIKNCANKMLVLAHKMLIKCYFVLTKSFFNLQIILICVHKNTKFSKQVLDLGAMNASKILISAHKIQIKHSFVSKNAYLCTQNCNWLTDQPSDWLTDLLKWLAHLLWFSCPEFCRNLLYFGKKKHYALKYFELSFWTRWAELYLKK